MNTPAGIHSFTPREEIDVRIAKLQAKMAAEGLDGALIVQKTDLFYLSGTAQDAHLFVPVEGAPRLMVRQSYERAAQDSPLDDISEVTRLSDVKSGVVAASGREPRVLGMELDVLPVNNCRAYEALFPEAQIVDVSPLVKRIRMIKSAYEMQFIREAGRLSDGMYAEVKNLVREGMSEIEFAGLIELYYRRHGHQGPVRIRTFNQDVFYGHVMAGPNLAVPSCSVGPTGGMGPNPSCPQGPGYRPIGRHEPICIDYAAVADGYMIDLTRIFFIGELPEKFLRVHEVALAIQRSLVERSRPGTRAEELYDLAVMMAREAGLEEGFLGWPRPVPFVGHGFGLELDEYPVIGRKSPFVLEPGMVVAYEPKFIIPGEGMIGIENSYYITEGGAERLSLFPDQIQSV
ncbi:MAG: Xaa-Pro peptidase family protein [Desulfomonile sp.]|nr:Xaa-Pro peptidase family protein [Desulfomonile sp.]